MMRAMFDGFVIGFYQAAQSPAGRIAAIFTLGWIARDFVADMGW